MKKRILLIDADLKGPNLALMKISAWHKKQGHIVYLNAGCDPDLVYISCVFSQNKSKALGLAKFYQTFAKVKVGGTAMRNGPLPHEIEHIMPDYDLYGLDYSMGFTSRGCIRKCPWCVVWKNEGMIRDHTSIDEFWCRSHKKVVLLDNNFLASPRWRENIQFLIDRDLQVDFNQGLDIRLVTKEFAEMLSVLNVRPLRFSLDSSDLIPVFRKNIELVLKYFKPRNITTYCLIGFNETRQQDHDRLLVPWEYGVYPYAMPFSDPQKMKNKIDKDVRKLTRWCNHKAIFKTVAFKDYDGKVRWRK